MWSILTIALFSTILITEGNIIIESPPETNYGEWGRKYLKNSVDNFLIRQKLYH